MADVMAMLCNGDQGDHVGAKGHYWMAVATSNCDGVATNNAAAASRTHFCPLKPPMDDRQTMPSILCMLLQVVLPFTVPDEDATTMQCEVDSSKMCHPVYVTHAELEEGIPRSPCPVALCPLSHGFGRAMIPTRGNYYYLGMGWLRVSAMSVEYYSAGDAWC